MSGIGQAGGRSAHGGYDAELQRLTEVLRRHCDVRLHDRVLDIGCGSGQTTRDAARLARAGSALGVDIAAPAIERARELARAEALTNATFERADAQVHPFPAQHFDLAISRFGTMFFDDPVAAFANIYRALRPDGRLVMLVWQPPEQNEWYVEIDRALAGSDSRVDAIQTGPDPFSLAVPAAVEQILGTAGFGTLTFTDVDEPVYYGPDVPAAVGWVRNFACTSAALDNLDPAAAESALGRLREMLAAHTGDDGVWLDARAWVVAARGG